MKMNLCEMCIVYDIVLVSIYTSFLRDDGGSETSF